MARVCEVTGKGPMVGNNVSHANNKTKRRWLPNLQYRRFWVESENRWVRLRVSHAAMRTIDKNGIDVVLAELRAKLPSWLGVPRGVALPFGTFERALGHPINAAAKAAIVTARDTLVEAAVATVAVASPVGELADFMWNVAGAPPNSTGAPGRTICVMVMPASVSTMWKTSAPTSVTGAIRPISVTGTISTGMPASTQSSMFWHESSP